MKIYAAMNAVQSALSEEGISKGRRNQQQGYNFRGIDDCYNAISGLFAQNKVLPIPSYKEIRQEERQTKDGKAIFVTRLEGTFEFKSMEDGTSIVAGPFPGEAMDSADKSTNKAMSASYKYALMQVFTIPTEGDNDADASTPAPVRAKSPEKDSPTREEQRQSALVDVSEPAAKTPPAAKARHPLFDELDTLLAKYGKQRAFFEKKIAEALGLKSILDVTVAELPEAITRVMTHQAAASKAKEAGAAGKKSAAKKKPALPPPDDSDAPDLQQDDDQSDDRIPV